MRKINKRATELANTVPDKKVHGLIRHAYIKGARDQMRDDIESAVTALCACCGCGCELNPKYCDRLNEFKKELKLTMKE